MPNLISQQNLKQPTRTEQSHAGPGGQDLRPGQNGFDASVLKLQQNVKDKLFKKCLIVPIYCKQNHNTLVLIKRLITQYFINLLVLQLYRYLKGRDKGCSK